MWLSSREAQIGIAVRLMIGYALILHATAGSCNKEQADGCRDAVDSDRLGSYPQGGHCESNNKFAGYTHTCSSRDYRDGMDTCCCRHERRVMCCRYLSGRGLFRCLESDDTVKMLPSESTVPPLRVLLPVIILPVLVLLCCVFCIVKCCCYNYDSDDNDYCDIPCLRKSNDKTSKEAQFTTQLSSDQQPLNRQSSVTASTVTHYSRAPSLRHPPSTCTQFSTDSASSETKLLADTFETPSRRGQPSAPPVEEMDEFPDNAFISFNNNSDSRFTRLNSHASTASMPAYQARAPSSSHTYSRSHSEAPGSQPSRGLVPCPSCSSNIPSCPPPCYDDHHKDRVYESPQAV